jgi:PEP-CTERM motif
MSGLGSLKFAIDGNVTTLAAVPEPSTWAMMLIGFASLGFVGYRASRKSAAA